MYTTDKLESVFIELICPNTSNLIIGFIYTHSILHIDDFNSNHISPLLHKLSKETSKQIFLLGDFNIDLLKYESSQIVNSFLDTLSSNFVSPFFFFYQFYLPKCLPRLLIFIFLFIFIFILIFCNLTHTRKSVSGNLTFTVFDHLSRVLILLEFFSNAPLPKYNICIYDWKKFDKEKFIFEFITQDCDNFLVLDKENIYETIDNYLANLRNLLEKHAPLKKLNKQGTKFQQKPWITKGLQVSVK